MKNKTTARDVAMKDMKKVYMRLLKTKPETFSKVLPVVETISI